MGVGDVGTYILSGQCSLGSGLQCLDRPSSLSPSPVNCPASHAPHPISSSSSTHSTLSSSSPSSSRWFRRRLAFRGRATTISSRRCRSTTAGLEVYRGAPWERGTGSASGSSPPCRSTTAGSEVRRAGGGLRGSEVQGLSCGIPPAPCMGDAGSESGCFPPTTPLLLHAGLKGPV